MKVLLITNYRKDNQKSMIRFGNLLSSGDYKNIEITEIFPLPRMINLYVKSNFKKWAGYIDKYIIFPRKIEALFKKKSYDIIHIIDHSNSVYLKKISKLTKARAKAVMKVPASETAWKSVGIEVEWAKTWALTPMYATPRDRVVSLKLEHRNLRVAKHGGMSTTTCTGAGCL